MKVLFIAGFGPIVRNSKESRSLYIDALGVKFKEEEGGYLHTEGLDGSRSFALWPLEHAAQSCFGLEKWPENIPEPNSWMEFDVDDIDLATKELEEKGYHLIVKNRHEPWGQDVSRFLSPEGILVGITRTPWMREHTE